MFYLISDFMNLKYAITALMSIAFLFADSDKVFSQSNTVSDPNIKKIVGHWHDGLGHFYSIFASHDTVSVAEGFLTDTGPTLAYKHVSGNKFRYIGYYSFETGRIETEDEGDIDGVSTFDVKMENGIKCLYRNGDLLAKDTATINNALVAGYYKGKTKQYYIDQSNKNCTGFAAKSFTARMVGDGAIFDDDDMSDVLLVFGETHFNTSTGRLTTSSDNVIDVLKRIYPDNTKERYPFTATDELDVEFLEKVFSFDELKIMRNEIFARHGYIFTTDAMKKHFSAQTWYKPSKSNVDNLLNPIEKKNISTIKDAEARLKLH